ncbi:hypothetical protein [Muricoccus radiodurans]|uniref:hypothetical protein n=1 Tax=Muricoccus radiodurans TaxID=2231721 RepID=UPI003CF4E775
MIKASLLIMTVLTVLISMGLRWRQARTPQVAAVRRASLIARGKKGFDRWITAAAIAAVVTIALLGGLHWLKVFAR